MAVTSINKVGTLSGSERSLQLSELWQVVVDDPNTDINVIFGDGRLPQPGQSHPSVNWLFCFDRRPRVQLDSRLIWEIEIEWSQSIVDNDILEKVLASSNPADFTAPEFRPPTKSWRTAEVLEPLRFHECTTRTGQLRQNGAVILNWASGRLIVNTAGVVPETPPQKRVFNRVFQLTRYEANFVDANSEAYLGKVNSATFKDKDPYTVICTMMDAENKYVQAAGGPPRELALVTYQFEYSRNGQWIDIPNVSLVEWPGTGEPVDILDDNDNPISQPRFLDEAGLSIPFADLPEQETYIRTFPYEETDFNALGL